MTQSKLLLATTLFGLLTIPGCDLVDSQVLERARVYFPSAEVIKPRPAVLHIETHVGNLSEKFISEVFAKMQQDSGRQLALAMAASGYKFLVLGFEEYKLVWMPSIPGKASITTPTQYAAWYERTFHGQMSVGYANAHRLGNTPSPQPQTEQAPVSESETQGEHLWATINTSMGAIVIRLFEDSAPITVRNFVQLARGGKLWIDPRTHQRTKAPLYQGTAFHRVIPGYMIQGGDPLGTGMGDGGLTPIPDEFSPAVKFDQPGRLAMANAGPRTGTCQFFITEVPTPHLDGKHTIFGQVVEGLDLVGKIARVPVDSNNKPTTPVTINVVEIRRSVLP